jgi:stage III sporulation protein AD
MEVVRIAVIGIGGVFLALLLKETKPEYATGLTLVIGLMILSLAVGKLAGLFEAMDEIRESLSIDTEYFLTLAKMIGITYVGQFSAGICKDAGFPSTGVQIELFCRLSLLMLSMPILLALLETIEEFLS